ncbi:hypothetical protein ACFC4G_47290 [Streptomyces sp. NPDC056002]|uniref:hypothetical protein n=1 Tax=Streptomyces sp. NPDC056002 TaxID=3345675 RepID=UPI0035D95896
MSLFSNRGRRPRLAPELDDADLGKLLKRLTSNTRSSTPGTTDLCVAQIARFLEQNPGDFDLRAHRVSVLAGFLSESNLPAAWVQRDPSNASALVLHSWSAVERGRAAGRLTDASSVWERCQLVAELDPRDPTPWVVMLSVARLERYPTSDVFATWNEIVTRDRWHREAYLGMLEYLSPQESGSIAQVVDFVDSVRGRMPSNAPCAAVELAAHVMQYHAAVSRGGAQALLARNHWNTPQAADLLERARTTWPQRTFFSHAAALADLNLLAYALTAANRRRQAAPLFTAIGGSVTSWPWRFEGDPLAAFESAHHKAR